MKKIIQNSVEVRRKSQGGFQRIFRFKEKMLFINFDVYTNMLDKTIKNNVTIEVNDKKEIVVSSEFLENQLEILVEKTSEWYYVYITKNNLARCFINVNTVLDRVYFDFVHTDKTYNNLVDIAKHIHNVKELIKSVDVIESDYRIGAAHSLYLNRNIIFGNIDIRDITGFVHGLKIATLPNKSGQTLYFSGWYLDNDNNKKVCGFRLSADGSFTVNDQYIKNVGVYTTIGVFVVFSVSNNRAIGLYD